MMTSRKSDDPLGKTVATAQNVQRLQHTSTDISGTTTSLRSSLKEIEVGEWVAINEIGNLKSSGPCSVQHKTRILSIGMTGMCSQSDHVSLMYMYPLASRSTISDSEVDSRMSCTFGRKDALLLRVKKLYCMCMHPQAS